MSEEKSKNPPETDPTSTTPEPERLSTKKKFLVGSLGFLGVATPTTATIGIPLGFTIKPEETTKALKSQEMAEGLNRVVDFFKPLNNPAIEGVSHFPIYAAVALGTGVGIIALIMLIYYCRRHYSQTQAAAIEGGGPGSPISTPPSIPSYEPPSFLSQSEFEEVNTFRREAEPLRAKIEKLISNLTTSIGTNNTGALDQLDRAMSDKMKKAAGTGAVPSRISFTIQALQAFLKGNLKGFIETLISPPEKNRHLKLLIPENFQQLNDLEQLIYIKNLFLEPQGWAEARMYDSLKLFQQVSPAIKTAHYLSDIVSELSSKYLIAEQVRELFTELSKIMASRPEEKSTPSFAP